MPFTIKLPTKPYVRHFIITNYGETADFSIDKDINSDFRRSLSKPFTMEESKYEELSLKRYSTVTQIKSSEDDFCCFGYELAKTDIVSFGKKIEGRVKFFMRNMVGYYSTIMIERMPSKISNKLSGTLKLSGPLNRLKGLL